METHKENVATDERKIGCTTCKACNKSRWPLLEGKKYRSFNTPSWPCSHGADTENELLRRANLRGLLAGGRGKGRRDVVRRFYGRTRRSPESASTSLQLELSED